MSERIVDTNSSEQTSTIFGVGDCYVRRLEDAFSCTISNRCQSSDGRGDALIITGSDEGSKKCALALEYFKRITAAGDVLEEQTVEYVITTIEDGHEAELGAFDSEVICITSRGKPIKAKTIGQKKYIEAIRKNTIVLGVGPAGTGKTFLAVAMAVEALRQKQVSRIILTRPAIEAGEKLGFLPGDLQNKIDPYLRPLYDALYEMMGAENFQKQMERGTIEIAPLAYMRGRTLDDSFIILDEAQNTTCEQMKMFLTRLGYRSKIVVTGDPSQTDLPNGKKSGLSLAVQILKNVEDIYIHEFTERDIVRHRLVQHIIKAFEQYERSHQEHAKTYRLKRN